MRHTLCILAAHLIFVCISSAQQSTNIEIVDLLSGIANSNNVPENPAASEARLEHFIDGLAKAEHFADSLYTEYQMSNTYLEIGQEDKAIELAQRMLANIGDRTSEDGLTVMRTLALAYLRHGERINCLNDHSAESCIFPIKGQGLQKNTDATKKAIKLYEEILGRDNTDMNSRWLLNLANMAIGEYPGGVHASFLIPHLDKHSSLPIKPFREVAMETGLNVENMAGGSIMEDFNNDGLLDVVSSGWGLNEPMHYHQNNGDGTFTNLSASSGINLAMGGLHIAQTDYNNDGFKDIFVLRGAWMQEFGRQPNSLLRNNGDGTFTDVTIESGLLSFHPTQTATWADFNNDGWLDVFIGNETTSLLHDHPCELFLNNGDGTFANVAKKSNADLRLYVKGVTSGDFDNDGRIDLFISTMNGKNVLLKNKLNNNGRLRFEDVSDKALKSNPAKSTFSTWFWDFDNDGWLDLFFAGYDASNSLARFAAEDALGVSTNHGGALYVYQNMRNGTFRNVSAGLGFGRPVFAMSSNFGDINNDGYADIYLGTGNPLFQSQIPNKLFLNMNGKGFADATGSARVGNLQKGHGISFGDINNDGNLDIHIDMGGAYPGDAYQNSLFINPGQQQNKSIALTLEGRNANRAAIGARIKATFRDNGQERSVYGEVNSGSSFGANTLTQHIGIGAANEIDLLEITWPGSNVIEEFRNIAANQRIKIVEGDGGFSTMKIKSFDFPQAQMQHHH